MNLELNAGTVPNRMTHDPPSLKAAWGFAAVCLLLLLLHTHRAVTMPLDQTLAVVPDDAFYYLRIAQNIAEGHGSTFDGLHATNGYHPLWMACLVVLASLVGDGMALLRAAQLLAFAFQAAGAVLAFQLLRPLVRRPWGIFCASAWSVTPWCVLQATQAMEASLYQACIFFLLMAHRDIQTHGNAPRAMKWIPYTAALVGVGLARTDGLVLCAASAVVLAAQSLRAPEVSRHRLRALASSAVVATVVWSLWAFASWHVVGTILQDSAAMKTLWRIHGAALANEPTGALAVVSGVWFGYPLALLAGGAVFSTFMAAAKVLLVGTVLLALGGRPRDIDSWQLVLLVLGWAIGSGVLYGSRVTDLQIWHFVPAAVALFVSWAVLAPIAALRVGAIVPSLSVGIGPVGGVLAATSVVYVSWFTLGLRVAPYPWQPDVYHSLERFERHLGPGDRVGSFNAGIPAYFSRRAVVNLDGLVNHAVVAYWQTRTWNRYLCDARITHIADERASLQRALKFTAQDPVLTEIDAFPLEQWSSGSRYLWRVEVLTCERGPVAPKESATGPFR